MKEIDDAVKEFIEREKDSDGQKNVNLIPFSEFKKICQKFNVEKIHEEIKRILTE